MKTILTLIIIAFLVSPAHAGFGCQVEDWEGLPASASTASFSDAFTYSNGDLTSVSAYWTSLYGTALQVSSNTVISPTGSDVTGAAYYNHEALVTANGYALVTIPTLPAASSVAICFRVTDVSTHHYLLGVDGSSNLWWQHMLSGTGTSIAETTLAMTNGDKLGVTWTGTGDDTVVRVWKNPTATSPVSASEWDSGDSTPDVSLTDNPGANAVDSGGIVGIELYEWNADVVIDDFYAGDL